MRLILSEERERLRLIIILKLMISGKKRDETTIHNTLHSFNYRICFQVKTSEEEQAHSQRT